MNSHTPLPFCEHDVVVVAVSGGADSVALLHFLQHHQTKLSLRVCHLNHTLRGEESTRDRDFVVSLCQKEGIACFVKELDIDAIAKQTKQSLETCAREQRYAFFLECVEKIQQTTNQNIYIATGHTASDLAETVCFRLARGTSLAGLCGIPARRENIVRPLLPFSREEILAYCTRNNLAFVEDSSNASLAFTRNRIRHKLLPLLEEIHPKAEYNIVATANLLADDEDFLLKVAQLRYEELCTQKGLLTAKLQHEHPAIQRRILVKFLKEHDCSPSGRVLLLLQKLIFRLGVCQLAPQLYAVVGEDFLTVQRLQQLDSVAPYQEKPLCDGVFQSRSGVCYRVQTKLVSHDNILAKKVNNSFDFFLDCGKIQGRCLIRHRKPGDRIQLEGHTFHKTLKHLFQEKGVGVPLREKLFLLQDEEGILAIEQIGITARAVCDQHTQQYLQISAMGE